MAQGDENVTNPQEVPPTPQAPHTLSTIKLPILKKREYDIWAMKMEHYLEHIDYPIWEIIQKGNGPVQVSTDTNGQIRVLPPKTANEISARERETKARTTLLMAIPEDHLAKFYKMTDAKEMWEAIKSRFSGNDESKKMQKYLLKQQFESFHVSNLEGLHKGYNRFQSLLSQLEAHGVDTLNFDDLYNNLGVFESDVKGSTGSSSSTHNVAFVSSDNTSSTNEVNTSYGVSTSSGHNSQKEGSSSYTDDLMYSFFANQSSGPQLDHEDLEQVDEFDLKEMDLKWKVATISTRLEKFYKKTGTKLHFDAKEPVGFDKRKVKRRDAGNTGYKEIDNEKRPAKQDEHKAMVTIDGEGVDWTGHAEDDTEDYSLMAFNSSNSSSDTESTTSESDAKTSDLDFCESSSGEETLETMPKPVESKPKVVNKPKVWSDAPIIEEYESDSDDEYVSKSSVEQDKPSCAFINTVKHDNPHQTLKGKGIVDSGCSRNMSGNKAYLVDYQDFHGGPIAFGGLTCLIAKATTDESTKWHRSLLLQRIKLTKLHPKETNNGAGTHDSFDAENSKMEADHAQEYFVLPLWSSYTLTIKSSKAKNGGEKPKKDIGLKSNEKPVDQEEHAFLEELERLKRQEKEANNEAEALRKESAQGTKICFVNQELIEAIKIFLAFASYMGFIVYQMDVKSAFLDGKINEEVYVSQPLAFIDAKFINKVYKVVKALYGLHQAPRACVKTASTPIETKKPFVKDEEATDVDVHLYRSMTGSLMYLTASRPDIIESDFDLEAYSHSDYTGANLDRKSTIGGCQFLSRRLILWQCKKQTIVATSNTEAEYVATASYCGQVLWIQNQMHHFIRDANEKKLIQMLKIHTDNNVADLLTKAFDVNRNFVLLVQKLILLGLACAAQLCFTMVMLLRLGKKMQFELVLGALNEKIERNSEFHEIVDFLTSNTIHHAFT
nr:ribonuclease H-like domain-containing protein [Tanacetum cinerariifolium]